MKTLLRTAAVASALLALPVFADSKVEIAFSNPEKFADIKTEHLDDGSHRAEMLKLIGTAFAATVSPLVKDGYHLNLTFTDIDLAGDYREGWQVGATRLRLVSVHYAPRLAFDFTLTDAAGRVMAAGHRDITDHAFLEMASASDRDAFKYESQILRRWARKELSR